jgi:hypothetical protein
MYTVLFPSGRTEVFRVKELAETYAIAFKGILIGAPVAINELEVIE